MVSWIFIIPATLIVIGLIIAFNAKKAMRGLSDDEYEKSIMARTSYHRLKITEPRLPVPNSSGAGMHWDAVAKCLDCSFEDVLCEPSKVKSWRWVAAGFSANPLPSRGPFALSCARRRPGEFVPPDLSELPKASPFANIPMEH